MWRDQLARDVRSAFRVFERTPGPTSVIILTLALGIGATTAIFSVVNAVLLQPLPYPDPDRLVRIVENVPSPGNGVPAIRTTSMRHEDFESWRARFPSKPAMCASASTRADSASPSPCEAIAFQATSVHAPAAYAPLRFSQYCAIRSCS